MLTRSKRFVTTIQVADITGKSHIFIFAPYTTIKNLKSQVNAKFRITSTLYWLSCCGKLFTFGWNKQNSFHEWKIDWRCSMLIEGMWKWGRIKKIWQHDWAVQTKMYPWWYLYLKVLKILGYMINITAVYQLKGISLQQEKLHQITQCAAMPSWVSWRPHHALWHVQNPTIRWPSAVMFPARNTT